MSEAASSTSKAWVRQAANAAPAVGFLVALIVTRDFRQATWALMALSVAALVLSLVMERRIAPIPAFSGGMALAFGALSLVLRRPDILQMKMTIVDGLLGAALFAGLAFKRHPLKLLLGGAITLPDHAWRALTIRYGLFFWACALANEVVRRTQTAEVWAMFRVAAIAAAVLFGLAQAPLLKKYWVQTDLGDAAEPPDAGF